MLTEDQYTLLKAEADVAGLSLGELVRRALDHVYRPWVRFKVRGWEISFAIWKRPDAAVVARRIKSRGSALSVLSNPDPSQPERR